MSPSSKLTDLRPSPVLKNSRYNFHLRGGDRTAFYNALTGAINLFEGEDALALAEHLCGRPRAIDTSELSPAFVDELISCGFILPAEVDEVEIVASRFEQARNETPAALTITTTQDCNLGCYYCYEKRDSSKPGLGEAAKILEFAKEHVQKHALSSLHVNWYGGEPLLNRELIDFVSPRLQGFCSGLGVSYRASIISNGTLWPSEVAEFVRQHKLVQVQVSFDGLEKHHNKRRHFRRSYEDEDVRSSFQRAADLVDQLVRVTRVDLRLNLDPANAEDLVPFIKFATDRRWFEQKYPARLQIAKVSNYTDRVKFLERNGLAAPDFEGLRRIARETIPSLGWLDDAAAQHAYPDPKDSVCAALAKKSVVIGADGALYRCGLQVGERSQAVGSISGADCSETHQSWWEDFAPTKLDSCRKCSFLPVCWGGCAKRHLDQNEASQEALSHYWRSSLPNRIVAASGISSDAYRAFTEAEQFRGDEIRC